MSCRVPRRNERFTFVRRLTLPARSTAAAIPAGTPPPRSTSERPSEIKPERYGDSCCCVLRSLVPGAVSAVTPEPAADWRPAATAGTARRQSAQSTSPAPPIAVWCRAERCVRLSTAHHHIERRLILRSPRGERAAMAQRVWPTAVRLTDAPVKNGESSSPSELERPCQRVNHCSWWLLHGELGHDGEITQGHI